MGLPNQAFAKPKQESNSAHRAASSEIRPHIRQRCGPDEISPFANWVKLRGRAGSVELQTKFGRQEPCR